jgi:hypothetical protein
VLANVHFDTSVTYEGTKSIRIDPIGNSTNIGRECDSNWMAVSIGETIVFSCWMKTTASGLGDTSPQSGARIGIDFYGADPVTGGYITGIAYAGAYTQTPTSSQEANNYVSWGTSVWTLRTLDFVVPSVVYDPSGHAVAPTGIIPWMQVWSSTYGGSDPGQAWFADPTLYINP